jgi:hypothetical protein
MKIDGGCHCGKIAFEAEVDPEGAFICNCTDCQTLSGAPFRVVVFTPETQFKLLAGKPKVYVKTAESGRKREQTFCPECGTPIYSGPVVEGGSKAGGEPRLLGIRVGAVRQRDKLVPRKQYYRRSAQGWLDRICDLPDA